MQSSKKGQHDSLILQSCGLTISFATIEMMSAVIIFFCDRGIDDAIKNPIIQMSNTTPKYSKKKKDCKKSNIELFEENKRKPPMNFTTRNLKLWMDIQMSNKFITP